MKRCPECRRDYHDDTLLYCLDDGMLLLEGPASTSEAKTAILPETPALASEKPTRPFIHTEAEPQGNLGDISEKQSFSANRAAKLLIAGGIAVLLLVGGFIGYRYFSPSTKQIESIAVMPFLNESGNVDVEYLSDGMTDSLIYSLSQVPKLSVKARSSVFRYKGRDVEPQQVGNELSVQAVLNGRVIQLGDQLTLSLGLVDTRTGNQIWGEQYVRKRSDLISLQAEIARDVSNKLRVKLSSADERKVARNYTTSIEAYELYLKGRYHVVKMKPKDVETSIDYFKQAIEVDPSYAFAYIGLADAYRAQALSSGEKAPTEYLPKAKIAVKRAIEIDDAIADAHGSLGFVLFWSDWDWPGAERECKRAIDLDPNIAEAHVAYAHFFMITGRMVEAIAEIKRARELEPLNLRINTLEAQFLIYAGRPDDALARTQKVFELDPNFWFAHLFAASAYIDKGMFAEAADEARKAKELSGSSTFPAAQLGYALAKEGKQAEARAVLDEVLKLSTTQYIPPYHLALLYAGLGERDQAIAWLQRGFQQREPLLVFLNVEPKWAGLRADPRFKELVKKIGLPQ